MEMITSKVVKYTILHLEILIDTLLFIASRNKVLQFYKYSLGRSKGALGKPRACFWLEMKLTRAKYIDSEHREKLSLGIIWTTVPMKRILWPEPR